MDIFWNKSWNYVLPYFAKEFAKQKEWIAKVLYCALKAKTSDHSGSIIVSKAKSLVLFTPKSVKFYNKFTKYL